MICVRCSGTHHPVATITTRTSHPERDEGQLARAEWFSSAQLKALNPALVMILIPFKNVDLEPALQRLGQCDAAAEDGLWHRVLGFA